MTFTPLVVDDTIAKLKNICEAEIVREPHYHVVRYPGPEVLSGPIHHRVSADRIAMDVSVAHPDVQIHVKFCRGGWCK